jgi:hypothetical protein
MTLPAITSGNGTTLVGSDTQQTLTNKTILIDEDNLVITDAADEAIFQLNWAITSGARRSYFLPDAGTVTTTAEPTATASTLLDTKAEQTSLNKTLVNLKLAKDAEEATSWAQFNTTALTANRTITMPDQNIELVGTTATQILSGKTLLTAILADPTDNTKKITFNIANQNTQSNESFQFPPTNLLNNSGATNTIVSELATQDIYNKSLYSPAIKFPNNTDGQITLSAEGITGPRVIKFPDANATLLSTENVTLDDVTFGAGIGANNLTGLTRQQQFFYSGF